MNWVYIIYITEIKIEFITIPGNNPKTTDQKIRNEDTDRASELKSDIF